MTDKLHPDARMALGLWYDLVGSDLGLFEKPPSTAGGLESNVTESLPSGQEPTFLRYRLTHQDPPLSARPYPGESSGFLDVLQDRSHLEQD